jgi:hypothetical protein
MAVVGVIPRSGFALLFATSFSFGEGEERSGEGNADDEDEQTEVADNNDT